MYYQPVPSSSVVDVSELEQFNFSSVEQVIIKKIKEVDRIWVDHKIPLFEQIVMVSL